MKKICLVGPVGSGKSTYLKHAKKQGIQTFNSDFELKEYVYVDNSVVKEISETFFKGILQNPISFNQLKNNISSEKDLLELEKILHPTLEKRLKKWFQLNTPQKVVIAEIPLVFEVGWKHYFDEIWYVEPWNGDEKEQFVKRAEEKKWSASFSALIHKRGLSSQEKRERCDRSIRGIQEFDQELKKLM